MSTACQLCGGTSFEPVSERDRHGGALRTVLCKGCGVVTNDPIPTDAELAAFYSADYRTAYKGVAEPRMRQVWRNFRRLEKQMRADAGFYEGRRRCLDLGSGSGEFMAMAGRLGMECIGVEPNRAYAQWSREKFGLEVLAQTLEETGFAPGSFDLIRLSHVMEHMRDPVRSLKVLREWLADDGLIYVEVPDIEIEARQKLRGRIFHYGHIFNFNPFTFRAALGLAGFVEHPDSAKSYAPYTAGFFGKGPAWTREQAANADNARRVLSLLREHQSRLMPAPQEGSPVGRAFAMAATRLGEMVAARRFATPQAIAAHFGDRLAGRALR